jgi:hypothetical protein
MLETHDCLQGTFESVSSGIAPIGIGNWVSIPICRRLKPIQASQLGRSFILDQIQDNTDHIPAQDTAPLPREACYNRVERPFDLLL